MTGLAGLGANTQSQSLIQLMRSTRTVAIFSTPQIGHVTAISVF